MAALLAQPADTLASPSSDLGGLTMEELDAWADQMVNQAMLSSALPTAQATEDGYTYAYDFATFYLDTPTWNKDSVVNAIVVTGYDTECPRQVGISDTPQAVLEAYANENSALTGSHDFAVLYLSDNSPEEVLWGLVQRDGQQIDMIQYAVHEQLADQPGSYTDCGLVYSLTDGYVTAVRAYGLSASISREQLDGTIAQLQGVQGDGSYFAYPQSTLGTDLDPFGREDLIFSGMDFLSLTPEAAVAQMGPYQTETWIADDTGEWMRVIQWPGAEITFLYTKDKVLIGVDTVDLYERGVEGPRAVMVGDSLSSVMMRFRHGDGSFDGSSTEVLYGDGTAAPYGLAEYAAGSATLTYVLTVEDGQETETVTLYMIFTDTKLSELLLYSW